VRETPEGDDLAQRGDEEGTGEQSGRGTSERFGKVPEQANRAQRCSCARGERWPVIIGDVRKLQVEPASQRCRECPAVEREAPQATLGYISEVHGVLRRVRTDQVPAVGEALLRKPVRRGQLPRSSIDDQ
jgi:hypothetical protein